MKTINLSLTKVLMLLTGLSLAGCNQPLRFSLSKPIEQLDFCLNGGNKQPVNYPQVGETETSLRFSLAQRNVKWSFTIENETFEASGDVVDIELPHVGYYSGHVTGEDKCGNIQEENFEFELIGKLKNTNIVINNNDPHTNKELVHLSLEAENADSMYVTEDSQCLSGGKWENYHKQKPWKLSQLNQNAKVYVKFKSRARESACLFDNIIHDNTGPEVSFVKKPSAVNNLQQASFKFSAIDSLTGVDIFLCRLDQQNLQACSLTEVFNDLKEGQHFVDIQAVDNAGNSSKVQRYTWETDLTPPSVRLLKAPSNPHLTNDASFVFEGKDNSKYPITFECDLNNNGYQPCHSPLNYSALAEGNHEFKVRARDLAGNISPYVVYSWLQDSIGPKIQFTQTPSNPTSSQNAVFNFTVTDSGTGVNRVSCSLDNASLVNCLDTYLVTDLAVGQHSFSVQATDGAGHVSMQTYNWDVTRNTITEKINIDPASKKLDIVVIVDNSDSMWKEQQSIGRRFSSLMDQITGLDWQLGIITTDARGGRSWESGRLVPFWGIGGDTIITSQTPNVEYKFKRTVYRPENGSAYEEGIKSLNLALDRPENQILFRDKVHLAAIVVSDADEASNGDNLKELNTPESVIQHIDTKWNGEKGFSFHSIIVPPDKNSHCSSSEGRVRGYTYARLSEMTNGIIGNICAYDYGNQLADIGDAIKEEAYAHKLKCEPLDYDGDGEPDLTLTFNPQPSQPVETVVEGDKLYFRPYPEDGAEVQVTYFCP